MIADLGHGAAVLVRQPKRRVDAPCALNEESDSVGSVELADREFLLRADSQRCPTRHDDLDVGPGALEQRVDMRCRRHQVLEIVEDQQDRSTSQEGLEPIDRRGLW